MNYNTNKTEAQEAKEKAKAILAVKFASVEENSVLYWHYLTIKEGKE